MSESTQTNQSLQGYVKHLRTVHFSLIVVCTVLAVISLTRVKSDFELALAQLDEILQVVNQWHPRWLEDGRPEMNFEQLMLTGDSFPNHELRDPAVKLEPVLPLITTLHPAPDALLDFVPLEHYMYFPFSSEHPPLLIKSPKTLTEFKALWDGLGETVTVYSPKKVADEAYVYILNKKDDTALGGIKRSSLFPMSNNSLPKVKLIFDMINDQEVQRVGHELKALLKNYTHAYVGAAGTPGGTVSRIILPVTAKKIPIDGQGILIKMYGAEWEHGPFAHIFMQLARATEQIQGLKWDRIRAILELEVRRNVSQYQFFGFAIPTSEVLKGGLFAMLGCQLYLLLHLNAFRTKQRSGDSAIDMPWIGIYANVLSKLATIVSALILPSVAVTVFSVRLIVENASWVSFLAILAIIASLTISIRTLIEFQKVWMTLKIEEELNQRE